MWDTVAHALVQLAHNLVLSFAPRRILFGGGVALAQPALLPRIRSGLAASLGGYLDLERLSGGVDALIVPAGLGALAGPSGALAVAADALTPR